MFKPVEAKPDFPKIEEKIIKFWKKNKIFEKSVKSRPKDKNWTFLDGPPFITGLPHYGSLLSSIPKDLFPRFWTMKGYRVRRVWGWDCHGLPAENKVEEKLNIKRKKDIEEKIGVRKFIEECKLYVSRVSAEWEWYVDHIGRWVDFKNAYRTMDLDYMETVMWVFKKMYERGYIYKGIRVSLFCPHCSTPISNFEVAMDADNYKEVTEPATVYKYQLKDEKNTFLLAWSTTPWNKLVTPALAINPKLTYIKVKQGKEKYILAKSTLKMLKNKPYKILEEFKGKDLAGWRFIPHYDFYPVEPGKKAFIVAPADFVTSEEGTGIVTIAAYGEDDLDLMKKENIQIVLHVDEEGNLKKNVPKWGGMYYLDVNKKVNKDLKEKGLLYNEDQYTHTIPTCWRCHTRLFYAPQDAWYVDIQKLKSQMKRTNKFVNWYPQHFKYGRFLKSMQAAPDWCISRSRYWGSPVPVWECVCGERYVPGSITELEKLSRGKIEDLHKPGIDKVVIKCQKCGQQVRRVPEVLDSWLEAGSAPYAERHYPFQKNIKLKDFFPPDFIVEYTGQIRAWFYVLHVISNVILKSHAFRNVVVTGVILGNDGRKMSKNYGNYPDPKLMLTKYGGDALRLYLLGSPVMKGEDILISEGEYKNQVKETLLFFWNSYKFFLIYATLIKWQPKVRKPEFTILDKWILGKLDYLIFKTTIDLDNYDTFKAIEQIKEFVNDLSKWYIRRSREREDKETLCSVLHQILLLLARVIAPFTPFIAEEIYKNITSEESVHLSKWPVLPKNYKPKLRLFEEIDLVRKICELGHSERKRLKIKVRQPLAKLKVKSQKLKVTLNQSKLGSGRAVKNLKLLKEYENLITEELNVKKIEWVKGKSELSVELNTKITPELKAEGEARELVRQIQLLRKKEGCRLDQWIVVQAPSWPRKFEEYIKKKTLAKEIRRGESLKIERKI